VLKLMPSSTTTMLKTIFNQLFSSKIKKFKEYQKTGKAR
jgi:hypothetical protein